MATPAIQTLLTDAQQVLNLKTVSEIRATLTAVLANANVGTPLNPNLTTQQLWDEFYEIVRQTPTDIESILVNQMMKFVFSPPAPGGAGANGQVIFNDGGVLVGDAGLTYNKATDALTITGDLTVRTTGLIVNATGTGVQVSPSAPLCVKTRNSDSVGLRVLQSTGGTAGIQFTDDPVTADWGSILATSANLFLRSNSLLQLQTGGATERFAISSTGVCTWSNVGGVAGPAMTLNSTGLGVGVSPSYRLDATDNNTNIQLRLSSSNNNGTSLRFVNTGTSGRSWQIGTGFAVAAGNFEIYDVTAAANRFTIDSSGNVGVGVTPSAGGTGFYKTFEIGKVGCGLFVSTAPLSSDEKTYFSGNAVLKYNSGPEWSYGNNGEAGIYGIENGVHKWFNAVSGTAGVVFTPTQAMTLDASGNLLLGTTGQIRGGKLSVDSSAGVASGLKSSAGSSVFVEELWNTGTLDNSFINFGTDSTFTARGSITYNRSGGLVAYNTTSDYRAKDIIGPVSNSGSVIDSLKVYIGKMKGASVERPMLVAHEAQIVAPYSVTGQKDEVDADGNPKYQQMDVSSFVPLLIAEIQSLRARVQTLEAR